MNSRVIGIEREVERSIVIEGAILEDQFLFELSARHIRFIPGIPNEIDTLQARTSR